MKIIDLSQELKENTYPAGELLSVNLRMERVRFALTL